MLFAFARKNASEFASKIVHFMSDLQKVPSIVSPRSKDGKFIIDVNFKGGKHSFTISLEISQLSMNWVQL